MSDQLSQRNLRKPSHIFSPLIYLLLNSEAITAWQDQGSCPEWPLSTRI